MNTNQFGGVAEYDNAAKWKRVRENRNDAGPFENAEF